MQNNPNEKDFPIESAWIVKILILSIPFALMLIALVLFYILISQTSTNFSFKGNIEIVFYGVAIILNIINVISLILQKAYFHFQVGEDNLMINQGVLSRKETHFRYGTIQGILINQGILDRILGICTLVVENAAMGAGAFMNYQGNYRKYRNFMVGPGVSGNRLTIPGLTLTNAEKLKIVLMKKIDKAPEEDRSVGL